MVLEQSAHPHPESLDPPEVAGVVDRAHRQAGRDPLLDEYPDAARFFLQAPLMKGCGIGNDDLRQDGRDLQIVG